MKIVDPHMAQALLHRKPEQIPPIMPSTTSPIQMQPNVSIFVFNLKSCLKILLFFIFTIKMNKNKTNIVKI